MLALNGVCLWNEVGLWFWFASCNRVVSLFLQCLQRSRRSLKNTQVGVLVFSERLWHCLLAEWNTGASDRQFSICLFLISTPTDFLLFAPQLLVRQHFRYLCRLIWRIFSVSEQMPTQARVWRRWGAQLSPLVCPLPPGDYYRAGEAGDVVQEGLSSSSLRRKLFLDGQGSNSGSDCSSPSSPERGRYMKDRSPLYQAEGGAPGLEAYEGEAVPSSFSSPLPCGASAPTPSTVSSFFFFPPSRWAIWTKSHILLYLRWIYLNVFSIKWEQMFRQSQMCHYVTQTETGDSEQYKNLISRGAPFCTGGVLIHHSPSQVVGGIVHFWCHFM